VQLNITSLSRLAICNAGLSSVITIAVIFVNFKSFNAMGQDTCVNPAEAAKYKLIEFFKFTPAKEYAFLERYAEPLLSNKLAENLRVGS
jgi:hypothetical protein